MKVKSGPVNGQWNFYGISCQAFNETEHGKDSHIQYIKIYRVKNLKKIPTILQ